MQTITSHNNHAQIQFELFSGNRELKPFQLVEPKLIDFEDAINKEETIQFKEYQKTLSQILCH